MKNHTPHSPGMTPTAHERMEWERMGEAAFKLSRAHTANKFWLASKFTSADIPIDVFDSLQSEYRSWLNYGFEPDMDAIKTREINVLAKENNELRSALKETLDALINESAGNHDSPWIASVKNHVQTILGNSKS